MRFIFEVTIKKGHTLEEYVSAWKQGSEVIQKMPGAHGTRLYRKIDDPKTLLAIAEWDSKEARDSAMSELENSNEATRQTIHRHREFGDIKKIGEFDETEWKVV